MNIFQTCNAFERFTDFSYLKVNLFSRKWKWMISCLNIILGWGSIGLEISSTGTIPQYSRGQSLVTKNQSVHPRVAGEGPAPHRLRYWLGGVGNNWFTVANSVSACGQTSYNSTFIAETRTSSCLDPVQRHGMLWLHRDEKGLKVEYHTESEKWHCLKILFRPC